MKIEKKFFVRPFFLKLSIIAAYVALKIQRIEHPDTNWEECRTLAAAFDGFRALPDFKSALYVDLLGRHFPLMRHDHVGTVAGYLMFPVFGVFGVNLGAVRVVELALSLAIACLFSSVVQRLTNPRAGVLAMFLILFHSTFFAFSKIGFVGETLLQQLFVALSAMFFVKAYVRPRPATIFTWALILGFGFYVKLLLLWQAAAYFVFFFFLVPRVRKSRRWLVGVVAFAGGICLSPFTLANVANQGGYVKTQFGFLQHRSHFYQLALKSHPEKYDFGFGEYVAVRAKSVVDSLGNNFKMIGFPQPPPAPLATTALCLALFVFPFAFFLGRFGTRSQRTILAGWVFVCFIFYIGICVPVTHPGEDHVLPVAPLAIAACAVAMTEILSPVYLVCAAFFLYLGHFARIAQQEAASTNFLNSRRTVLADELLVRGITRPKSFLPLRDGYDLTMASGGRIRYEFWDKEKSLGDGWYVNPVWQKNRNNGAQGASRRDFYAAVASSGKEARKIRVVRYEGVPAYIYFQLAGSSNPRKAVSSLRAIQSGGSDSPTL